MDNTPLSRTYLETLSSTDLIRLADDYGIDIPEGLNRRFIIGEILEMSEDKGTLPGDSGQLVDGEFTIAPEVLPETYNETQITVLLRDPGWVFVYWDFHSALLSAVTGNYQFESFFLRVNSLSSAKPAAVTDFFDVDVGLHDRKWYVHLSGRDYACRIDLYARNSQEREQLLAKSIELVIPVACAGEPPFADHKRNSPLVELSGFSELWKTHFRNHRQSFD